jgi:hypothetical protein
LLRSKPIATNFARAGECIKSRGRVTSTGAAGRVRANDG